MLMLTEGYLNKKKLLLIFYKILGLKKLPIRQLFFFILSECYQSIKKTYFKIIFNSKQNDISCKIKNEYPFVI